MDTNVLKTKPPVFAQCFSLSEQFLVISGGAQTRLLLMLVLFVIGTATLTPELLPTSETQLSLCPSLRRPHGGFEDD